VHLKIKKEEEEEEEEEELARLKGQLNLPRDEEDLALLNIFIGNKVEIKDSIAALVRWEAGSEVIIVFIRFTKLLNSYLLHLLFNLIDNEAKATLCLQFMKFNLTFVVNCHSRRRVCLPYEIKIL
jgi:hypothetical protein